MYRTVLAEGQHDDLISPAELGPPGRPVARAAHADQPCRRPRIEWRFSRLPCASAIDSGTQRTLPGDERADAPERPVDHAAMRIERESVDVDQPYVQVPTEGDQQSQLGVDGDDLLERAVAEDAWHWETYQRPISAETLRKRLHVGAARSRMPVAMVRSTKTGYLALAVSSEPGQSASYPCRSVGDQPVPVPSPRLARTRPHKRCNPTTGSHGPTVVVVDETPQRVVSIQVAEVLFRDPFADLGSRFGSPSGLAACPQ